MILKIVLNFYRVIEGFQNKLSNQYKVRMLKSGLIFITILFYQEEIHNLRGFQKG